MLKIKKYMAYTRVSKETQINANQKVKIYEYAHRNKFVIDKIVEIKISSISSLASIN